MRTTSKIQRIITILMAPAICWLFINFFLFGHYHKMPNGEIIYHAHPFKTANDTEAPFRSHKHSKTEYLLLALTSNPFFLISGIATIAFFATPTGETSLYEVKEGYSNESLKLDFSRAPPSIA